MKTINTLSVFITLGLALLITLILLSAPVHAAQLPTTQLEKVETVNVDLNLQAMQSIKESLITMQLVPTNANLALSFTTVENLVKTQAVNKMAKTVTIAE